MKRNRVYLFLFILGYLSISCGIISNLSGANGSNPSMAGPSNQKEVASTQSDGNFQSQSAGEEENVDAENTDGQSSAEGETNFNLPFPVVEDAFNIEEQYGNYRYQTNLSVEDASEFYRIKMQGLGYEIADDVFTGTGTIFSFERSDSIVTMNVIQNEQGSVTVNYAERNP